MNTNCVRVGIIGCGGIANGKHMPALAKLPNVKMVAFCDIIEERAVKARADYGTPESLVCTDYRELLADKTIDVVHVLTPNRWHSSCKSSIISRSTSPQRPHSPLPTLSAAR